MKRLILATTMALAVATMGSLPAAASVAVDGAAGQTALMAMPDPDGSADGGTPPGDTTDTGTDTGTDDSTSQGTDESSGGDMSTADTSGSDDSTGSDDSSGATDEAATDGSADPSTPAEADVEGTPTETPTESPSDEPIDASMYLESDEVTVEALKDPEVGIKFFVDGVKAGDSVAWGDGDGTVVTAETDGQFWGIYYTSTPYEPGDTVTVTVSVQRGDQNETYSASATVVGDDTEPPPSGTTLDITPGSQQVSDFLTSGVTVMMSGCRMDSDVNIVITSKNNPDSVFFETTQVAGEDTAAVVTWVPEVGDVDPDAFIGQYLVMADCGDMSQDGTFTVTADGDETLEPTLSVWPETISGADFVNRDKGVTMAVVDCLVADEVRFQVWNSSDVLLYDRTAPADGGDVAAVQTYGLENDPAAYVGKYTVQATCGDYVMNSGFTVTGSGGGGGGGNGGGGSGGGNNGSMPRTGAELTGLGAGAILILAGAGAVLFARRRGQMKG